MAATQASQVAAREVDDLFRRHGGEVYRYALAVLGNHADAEDITQTTFLNAYRSIEQGVRPRKPSNWLLTIASNAIKQKFRQETSRPRQVALDQEIAETNPDDHDGPTVGELLTALSRIPPQQRQAIVLREFEGRSYKEIAAILGVTTSALETLLFRARRSLAEELEHHLTCTEAQLAISRAADGRLGRKERRRLREHLAECPDCAQFARVQKRHRTALRGLMLVPVPVSFALFRGFEGTATAAVLPTAGTTAAGATAAGAGVGAAGATGGGLLAGGVVVKAAAVAAAASVAGGIGVVGATDIASRNDHAPGRPAKTEKGARLGQVAPRGVNVPGNGVARGKATAPGQTKAAQAKKRSQVKAGSNRSDTRAKTRGVRSAGPKASSRSRAAPKTQAPGSKADAGSNTRPSPKPKATTPKSSRDAKAAPLPESTGRSTPPKSAGGSTDKGGGKPSK